MYFFFFYPGVLKLSCKSHGSPGLDVSSCSPVWLKSVSKSSSRVRQDLALVCQYWYVWIQPDSLVVFVCSFFGATAIVSWFSLFPCPPDQLYFASSPSRLGGLGGLSFFFFFFFFSIHCSELQGLIRDWTSAAIFHFRGNIVWDFFFQLLSNLLTDVSEVQWLISNSEDVCASFLVSKIWNCFWCMTALFWSLSSHWMIVGPLCHIFSDYPGYIFWCWFCVNRTSDGLGRFGLCTVKNQLRTFLSFSAPFVGKFHSHECHPRVKRIASDCGALIPAVGNHFIATHSTFSSVSVGIRGPKKCECITAAAVAVLSQRQK